nr:BCCT family transporter [Hyphomonas sp. Mor2]
MWIGLSLPKLDNGNAASETTRSTISSSKTIAETRPLQLKLPTASGKLRWVYMVLMRALFWQTSLVLSAVPIFAMGATSGWDFGATQSFAVFCLSGIFIVYAEVLFRQAYETTPKVGHGPRLVFQTLVPTVKFVDQNGEYKTNRRVFRGEQSALGQPVFLLGVALVFVVALASIVFPSAARSFIESATTISLGGGGWLLTVTPLITLVFCLYLAISPLGRIRLGGESARPDYKTHSWIAMLSAAGVGIGFLLFGAVEPLDHLTTFIGSPPNAETDPGDIKRLAFSATILHWGLAPWGLYAIVGLSLGYFAHNKGLPLTIRSVLYPILREQTWSWPGHLVDFLVTVSTLFGIAMTIGIGTVQIAGGVSYLFNFDNSLELQMFLAILLTALAVISILRGFDGGVKIVSNINMLVAFVFLLFVIFAGPTFLIVFGFGENLAFFLADATAITRWIGRDDGAWDNQWTLFYWAWWISWSPFIGMFLARISRGRTVRQFISAVLIVPLLICVLWFSAFGETSISQYQAGIGELANGISDESLAMFQMLAEMPFSVITSAVVIMLLCVFVITSADSGALVIDTIASGGMTDAPVLHRIIWALAMGLTAAALIFVGGSNKLDALKGATITTALPVTLIIISCCFTLWMAMKDETHNTS